jgi:hypothetical protein
MDPQLCGCIRLWKGKTTHCAQHQAMALEIDKRVQVLKNMITDLELWKDNIYDPSWQLKLFDNYLPKFK